jgi:peptidoglycan/xylan/chitin deacetylase (PgdA/CDA1 family)
MHISSEGRSAQSSEFEADWPRLQRAVERLRQEKPRSRILNKIVHRIIARRLPPPGVYILLYHGVTDPGRAEAWEQDYVKGSVTRDVFREQMLSMMSIMEPLALSEVPRKFEKRTPDRAYFSVTFDDGYSNVFRNALEVARELNLKPTVFVNGHFASGQVYYRVLAARLVRHGGSKVLKQKLCERIPAVPWSDTPQTLFDQTKDHYIPNEIELAVSEAYASLLGDPSGLGVHLTTKQVLALQNEGWEFGDHTFAHTSLATYDASQVEAACSANRKFWHEAGVQLLPWIAYPNGRSADVGKGVADYIARHVDIHGAFGNGGINLAGSRGEWLRFNPGSISGRDLTEALFHEARLTRKALINLTRA